MNGAEILVFRSWLVQVQCSGIVVGDEESICQLNIRRSKHRSGRDLWPQMGKPLERRRHPVCGILVATQDNNVKYFHSYFIESSDHGK